MKNLIPFLFLLVIVSCTKEEFNPAQTREFSIQSVSNGATYPIQVALPENYDSTKKYITLYVLDGETDFDYVANQCELISAQYGESNILVVGIGYGNDRSLDYTPTVAMSNGGGAEPFMQFIKNELIPRMESEFGADTLRQNRILLGHSYGGLFATYAFTKYNAVFGNYFILSPSIWYDNEVMLQMEQQYRDVNADQHQLVFMGLGELENSGRMLAPYMALYQTLQAHYTDMQIMSHFEPHVDHLGSKFPNITEALQFYFQNQ